MEYEIDNAIKLYAIGVLQFATRRVHETHVYT